MDLKYAERDLGLWIRTGLALPNEILSYLHLNRTALFPYPWLDWVLTFAGFELGHKGLANGITELLLESDIHLFHSTKYVVRINRRESIPYHIWTERSIKSSHAGVKPVYRVVVRLKPPAPLPFCRIPLSLLSPLDPSTIRHADTGTGYANPAGTGTLCGGPSLTFLLCLLWITSCLDIWSKFGMSMVWKSVIVPTKEMKGRLLLQIPDSMYSISQLRRRRILIYRVRR